MIFFKFHSSLETENLNSTDKDEDKDTSIKRKAGLKPYPRLEDWKSSSFASPSPPSSCGVWGANLGGLLFLINRLDRRVRRVTLGTGFGDVTLLHSGDAGQISESFNLIVLTQPLSGIS